MRNLLLLSTFLVAACSQATQDGPHPMTPVSALTDCAREQGATLISAHRGGVARGIAENSLPGLHWSARQGAAFAEVDLRQTSDGHIVLLHDETLDRTSNGTGTLSRLTLAEILDFRLRDSRGRLTSATIPTLDEAFDAAAEAGIFLQLDLKTISPREAARAVVASGMTDRVIIIVRNEDQAASILDIDPGIAISLPIQSEIDLLNTDINLTTIVSWLGAGPPEARIEAALTGMQVESSVHDFSAEARGTMDYAFYNAMHVEVLAADNVVAAARILGRAGDHCPAELSD